MKTYGKLYIIKKNYHKVVNRFSLNAYAVSKCRSLGLGCYILPINKFKALVSGVGISICLVTLGTSWAIPLLSKWGLDI